MSNTFTHLFTVAMKFKVQVFVDQLEMMICNIRTNASRVTSI